MRVEIPRNQLIDAVNKMCDVSTRALVPDFNNNGLITIDAQDKQLVLVSSNGHLIARNIINIVPESVGVATVEAVRLKNVLHNIKTSSENDLISLEDKNGVVFVKDATSKLKRVVKLPKEMYDHNHKKEISKFAGDSLVFESDHFTKGVKRVSGFQSRGGYKPEYQLVLFHCTKDETRMVCGDGTIFAIFTTPRHVNSSKKEYKKLIPADQLLLINSLVSGSGQISLTWGDSSVFLETDNGIELCLKGLPNIKYIAYDIHAFRSSEAKAIVDIKVEDVHSAAGLVGALKDQEKIDLYQVLSCLITASDTEDHIKFEVTQKQSKCQCEYEVPAQYYNIQDQPSFSSVYAHLFLDGPASSARNEYLRFFLVDEDSIMIVKDVNLAESGENGVPRIKENSDGCSLSFFFSSISDTED